MKQAQNTLIKINFVIYWQILFIFPDFPIFVGL